VNFLSLIEAKREGKGETPGVGAAPQRTEANQSDSNEAQSRRFRDPARIGIGDAAQRRALEGYVGVKVESLLYDLQGDVQQAVSLQERGDLKI
jgi:hypothetical protein